jgi:hypothetical protein
MTDQLSSQPPGHSTDPVLRLVHELFCLAKRDHCVCEDPWYSCPKAPGGCSNDNLTGCDCGADVDNAAAAKVYADILHLLAGMGVK